MGTSRTSFAWLATALTVGLVSGLPHVTLANDAGPGKEVRAIRHDLPLLAGGLDARIPPANVRVTSVTVDGSKATATWTDASSASPARTSALERRYGLWWLEAQPHDPYSLRFDDDPALQLPDGYQMRVDFARNDASNDAALASVTARAPTEAESWMARGGNSYFFFSATLQSPAPVRVEAGTAIDVWFPFVLDTSLHYALTIAHADKPVGPIDGTLADNTVHFVLPAFTLSPGAHLMGEIEGDAWLHQ